MALPDGSRVVEKNTAVKKKSHKINQLVLLVLSKGVVTKQLEKTSCHSVKRVRQQLKCRMEFVPSARQE